MPDPLKNPRDEEYVRRLQEEQSEANDANDFIDPHADDLTQEEGDTTPENT
jgi:hypothetical protein